MKVYDWDKKLIIESPFPEESWEQYKFQADFVEKDPTPKQLEKIFLLARDDFKSGKLSLDGLSDICNVLFGIICKIQKPGDTSKLQDVLLAGGELNFYVRQTSESGQQSFTGFILQVLEYEKYLNF